MSEWGYMVPDGETKSYWLTSATRDGEFERGDVRVDTEPAGDLGNWDDVGVPMMDSPTSYGMQGATVRMPPADFYDLQTYIGAYIHPQGSNPEKFWRPVSPDRVETYKRVLRGEEEPLDVYDGLPMPFVEIGSGGTLRPVQEGRHRAVTANELGLDTMPVRIIYNPDKRGTNPRAATIYSFRSWREDRELPG